MVSLEKDNTRILLLEGIHEYAVQQFKAAGYPQVEHVSGALEKNELIEKMRTAHMVGIRSRTNITREVLDAAKDLIAIGNFCIGTNQVDLTEAKVRGIPVFNAPFSNTRSVAELVIAEIVMLLRGIPKKNAGAHRGEWIKSADWSFEIRGKKLGIVGYGNIGSQVSVLAEHMGMDVYFYDIEAKLGIGNAKRCGSLSELLSIADVVTLHVPATNSTEWMISQEQIWSMRDGSYLINASRGNVVDIPALAQALRSEKLQGAAIDVFPREPRSRSEEFTSELREFDNVLLTPHIGGSTKEAQENIALEVADKLIRYSEMGDTSTAVNFPRIPVFESTSQIRFLHIHHNVAGMLEKVNKVFSSRGINIADQFLQTNGEVGYVVVGIDPKETVAVNEIVEELCRMDGAIKVRMILNE